MLVKFFACKAAWWKFTQIVPHQRLRPRSDPWVKKCNLLCILWYHSPPSISGRMHLIATHAVLCLLHRKVWHSWLDIYLSRQIPHPGSLFSRGIRTLSHHTSVGDRGRYIPNWILYFFFRNSREFLLNGDSLTAAVLPRVVPALRSVKSPNLKYTVNCG